VHESLKITIFLKHEKYIGNNGRSAIKSSQIKQVPMDAHEYLLVWVCGGGNKRAL